MHRALALALPLSLVACAAPSADSSRISPIAAVRTGAPDARIAVEGVVTVKPGTFDAGFALQDASGGIYVTDARGAALALGARVRIEGRFALVNAQASITGAAVTRLGEGIVPAPQEVTTGGAGPATEGRLVVARGRMAGTVIDDRPWGWKFYIDDGSGALLIFVATATGIDLSTLRAGDQLRITGFGGRYAGHTELLPRTAADITPTGPH